SERTTETTFSAQRIMFQARKTYSQWSAGFRLTRTSARTVTNSIVNKATSADAAWISPVHQTWPSWLVTWTESLTAGSSNLGSMTAAYMSAGNVQVERSPRFVALVH